MKKVLNSGMEQKNELLKQALGLIIPEEMLNSFELSDVQESVDSIELELRECKELIPDRLKGADVVLDGFCNPIELQSFPLKGKATFIRLYRRRWKQRGSNQHESNIYDFADSGTKATRMFGAFLKGSFGLTSDTFQHTRDRFMRSRK